ncbi:MAG: serine/threonine-protein kinase [Gemmataceae bacterium]
MPVPTTADDFLAIVRKSGVVAPAELVEFAQRRPTDSPPTDAVDLAREMVREGLITRLQAGNLLRGKWRNLIIAEKYKLLEHLGRGGMGYVYLCEHVRLRRRVAIKILPPDKAADRVLFQRFEREARAAATLDHPNIVRAHDLDHHENLHFIVMDYVDGASLDEIVRRSGPLSIERACHYASQAAQGLQHAYEAGLIHRDVKPANLLLDRNGLVRLLDLGLARFFYDSEDLTRQYGSRHLNLIGTADYLAPEQATGRRPVDIRADIYGLGVTFYFLLTGRTIFNEGSVAKRVMHHLHKIPEPVRTHRPDVPEGVSDVIARMVAKDPADRFQTPAEVVEALAPWTASPIPPPADGEMPKLSLAARRNDTPAPGQSLRPEFGIPLSRPVPQARRLARWALIGWIGVCFGLLGWFVVEKVRSFVVSAAVASDSDIAP